MSRKIKLNKKKKKKYVCPTCRDNYILHHTMINENRRIINIWHDQTFAYHKDRMLQLAIFLQNKKRNKDENSKINQLKRRIEEATKDDKSRFGN